MGLIASRGVSVMEKRRKHLATCDVQGDPDPLPPLNPPMHLISDVTNQGGE